MDLFSEDEENIIEEDFDEKIKLMMLGDSNVGKSSILSKYCNGEFLSRHITTVGLDFQIKDLDINNKKIKVQIWDTAGQERYHVITKNFFKGSDGFIIIYDITSRESFDNINNWIEQINTFVDNNVKCIIFGNKNDLNEQRKVEINEGKELAQKYNYNFFETSAKDGNNVEKGFRTIILDILGDIKSIRITRRNSLFLKSQSQKSENIKNNCC